MPKIAESEIEYIVIEMEETSDYDHTYGKVFPFIHSSMHLPDWPTLL